MSIYNLEFILIQSLSPRRTSGAAVRAYGDFRLLTAYVDTLEIVSNMSGVSEGRPSSNHARNLNEAFLVSLIFGLKFYLEKN